jgi:cell division protein ZapA (FtsZ GTPase activity inhibitor)
MILFFFVSASISSPSSLLYFDDVAEKLICDVAEMKNGSSSLLLSKVFVMLLR